MPILAFLSVFLLTSSVLATNSDLDLLRAGRFSSFEEASAVIDRVAENARGSVGERGHVELLRLSLRCKSIASFNLAINADELPLDDPRLSEHLDRTLLKLPRLPAKILFDEFIHSIRTEGDPVYVLSPQKETAPYEIALREAWELTEESRIFLEKYTKIHSMEPASFRKYLKMIEMTGIDPQSSFLAGTSHSHLKEITKLLTKESLIKLPFNHPIIASLLRLKGKYSLDDFALAAMDSQSHAEIAFHILKSSLDSRSSSRQISTLPRFWRNLSDKMRIWENGRGELTFEALTQGGDISNALGRLLLLHRFFFYQAKTSKSERMEFIYLLTAFLSDSRFKNAFEQGRDLQDLVFEFLDNSLDPSFCQTLGRNERSDLKKLIKLYKKLPLRYQASKSLKIIASRLNRIHLCMLSFFVGRFDGQRLGYEKVRLSKISQERFLPTFLSF